MGPRSLPLLEPSRRAGRGGGSGRQWEGHTSDLQISRFLWRRRRRRRAHHATPRDGAVPRFLVWLIGKASDRQSLVWFGLRSGPWRLQGLVPTCLRRRLRATRQDATRRDETRRGWRFGCGHGVSCSGTVAKRSRQGRIGAVCYVRLGPGPGPGQRGQRCRCTVRCARARAQSVCVHVGAPNEGGAVTTWKPGWAERRAAKRRGTARQLWDAAVGRGVSG
jgi:hypothetical protein